MTGDNIDKVLRYLIGIHVSISPMTANFEKDVSIFSINQECYQSAHLSRFRPKQQVFLGLFIRKNRTKEHNSNQSRSSFRQAKLSHVMVKLTADKYFSIGEVSESRRKKKSTSSYQIRKTRLPKKSCACSFFPK